ncbi:kinase-like domain-containing protein [Terfezia claveryi]|nr:kinase-like domain-containing protein [Terfezia claveryi]
MPVIENLKNFIRHGKQAKNIHQNETGVSHRTQRHAHSDSAPGAGDASLHKLDPVIEYAVALGGDNRNIATRANATAQHQRIDDPGLVSGGQGGIGVTAGGIIGGAGTSGKYDDSMLARLIAEEKESKGKLPKYPSLERYTLLEKMGDGAFSNVYRGRDNHGEHGEVAIKVVRKYELSASQRANILKEVQIMSTLSHPNIVKLISFSESRSYYYLILELLPGGELFHQIVRLTYFSENLARHVIVQVAEALRYLHEEKGVVHRDIKPENLLFEPIPFIPTKNPKPRGPDDEEKEDEGEFIPGIGSGGIGKIKLADFGLSKVVWESQTMTPCGTVGYTAPEIVKDERYSKSVDMWAMGCVLYTLLCGFPPFYDESISVLTEKVAKGQYTFLSPWWDDISKSAQDLVSHLLTVDPEKRYSINEFMNHPWIKQNNEPTEPAEDAPPLATPALHKRIETPMLIDQDFTPGGATARRMDFRSPGSVALREVFDVGYAVHRLEEEGKRRKNWKQGYRGGGPLNPMDEEEDEYVSEDEMERSKFRRQAGNPAADDVAESLKKTNLTGNHQTPKQARIEQHRKVDSSVQKTRNKIVPFELSLDNATLLGRRKRPGNDHGHGDTVMREQPVYVS